MNGDIKYYITDHLHSTAMFADKGGTVLDDNDFYPWGGVVPGVGQTTSNNTLKFTGKYRDPESGLDYFGARYYASAMGRFMSPDWAAKPVTVPYANFGDPQSLNLYGYTENGPVNRIDADGHTYAGFDGFMAPRGNGFTTLDNEIDFEVNIEAATDAAMQAANAAAAASRGSSAQQQQPQTQQALSNKSEKAILNSNLTAKQAIAFEDAALAAGTKYHIDPNILVGLAQRESSLDPNAINGTAKGLFQITPGRQTDLGLSNANLGNIKTVVNAVAGSLASAMKTFGGNSSLAIASWTVGVGGTRAAFKAGGMQAVRNLLLDKNNPSYGRVGPDYIDIVTSFHAP